MLKSKPLDWSKLLGFDQLPRHSAKTESGPRDIRLLTKVGSKEQRERRARR